MAHTPDEYDFSNSLYQDHWTEADAYGIVGDDRDLLACIEVWPESWSNRLMITELWVCEALQKKDYGKRLMDKAKEITKEQKRRNDIKRREVRLNLGYFFDKNGW